jgi:hypothetical protein
VRQHLALKLDSSYRRLYLIDIFPSVIFLIGLPVYLKTDRLLHEAIDAEQSILFILGSVEGRDSSPKFDESLQKVEQLLLRQNKLLAEARMELRRIAPQDSPIWQQIGK